MCEGSDEQDNADARLQQQDRLAVAVMAETRRRIVGDLASLHKIVLRHDLATSPTQDECRRKTI